MTDLETFIEQSLIHSAAKGYVPTKFLQMRQHHGTVVAIKHLVVQPDIQTGFLRMRDLDLLDWTLEAAVLRFPEHFSRGERQAAQFRLDRLVHEPS